MFYRLKPWFEIMGFFVVVFAFFAFFVVICVDKCFSMTWMMDDYALC